MPNTPLLGITQVSASQNQKEVTINDAIIALEAATNKALSIDYTGVLTKTLTGTEATRNYIFKPTGAAADCDLKFPIAINGNPFNRLFVVRNESGYALTVKFATGAGSVVLVPNGHARLIAAMNGTDMIIAAEAGTAVNFVDLLDAPHSFVGQTGKFLSVNDDEDALEFVDAAVFPSYTGNQYKFLRVNGSANGVEWVTVSLDFLGLTDTPDSFAGQANKLVAVNGSSNALTFIDVPEAEAVEFTAAARWRLRTVTGTPGETQMGYGEIEIQDVDGIDLTGSGTASASTFAVGKEASYAFDNNTTAGAGWLSTTGDVVGSWIEYNFGSPVTPRFIKVWPINGFPQFTPTQFIIEFYNGTTWVAVGNRTPETWISETSQTFKVNGVPLTSVTDAPSDGSPYLRRNAAWEGAAEHIRDIIGATLVQGTNITITVNDAGDTITIASAGVDAEAVRDIIGAAVVEGAGIDITVNDAGDTITFASTIDAEYIRDTIGTALVQGGGISITVDDAGNSITISATGGTEEIKKYAYWRMTMDPNAAWGNRNFTEVVFLDKAGDPIPTLGGTAFGSSGSAPAAFDGDTASGIDMYQVGYQFGSPVGVGGITVWVPGSTDRCIGGYTLQYSDDGISYTTAFAKTLPGGVLGNVSFTDMDPDPVYVTTYSAPAGGTTGQILAKASNGDGDFAWITNVDAEFIRDTIGAALTQGSGITIAVDDSGNTITISNTPMTITNKTGDYVLTLADANTYVRFDNALALNVTVPPNSSVAYPIGTTINLREVGNGQLLVVAGVGVTINTAETLKLRKAGSSATLIKVATNEWDLTGDLELL